MGVAGLSVPGRFVDEYVRRENCKRSLKMIHSFYNCRKPTNATIKLPWGCSNGRHCSMCCIPRGLWLEERERELRWDLKHPFDEDDDEFDDEDESDDE